MAINGKQMIIDALELQKQNNLQMASNAKGLLGIGASLIGSLIERANQRKEAQAQRADEMATLDAMTSLKRTQHDYLRNLDQAEYKPDDPTYSLDEIRKIRDDMITTTLSNAKLSENAKLKIKEWASQNDIDWADTAMTIVDKKQNQYQLNQIKDNALTYAKEGNWAAADSMVGSVDALTIDPDQKLKIKQTLLSMVHEEYAKPYFFDYLAQNNMTPEQFFAARGQPDAIMAKDEQGIAYVSNEAAIQKGSSLYQALITEGHGFAEKLQKEYDGVIASKLKATRDEAEQQAAGAQVQIGAILSKKGMFTRQDLMPFEAIIQRSDYLNNKDDWQGLTKQALQFEEEAKNPPDDKTRKAQARALEELKVRIRDNSGRLNPLELRQMVYQASATISADGTQDALKYASSVKVDGEYDALRERIKKAFAKDPTKGVAALAQLDYQYDQMSRQAKPLDRTTYMKTLGGLADDIIKSRTEDLQGRAVKAAQDALQWTAKAIHPDYLSMAKNDLPGLLRAIKSGQDAYATQIMGQKGAERTTLVNEIAQRSLNQYDQVLRASGINPANRHDGTSSGDYLPVYLMEAKATTPGAFKDREGKYWFAIKPDETDGKLDLQYSQDGTTWKPLSALLFKSTKLSK